MSNYPPDFHHKELNKVVRALGGRQVNEDSYYDRNNFTIRPKFKKPIKLEIPEKPSALNNFEVEGHFNSMARYGYDLPDIYKRLDNLYKDFKKEVERRVKDAPPAPFKIGDLIGSGNSRSNFVYYRITKTYYEPFIGWRADADQVLAKKGIPLEASPTTIRRQYSKQTQKGINFSPEKGWFKVKDEEKAKLFSRHPHTTLFFQ